MIEKINIQKKLYALIVRSGYKKKKGVNFFSDARATQQFGYMNHKKGHIILPHRHIKRSSKIILTTEVIIILKGILRVDFYNNNEKYTPIIPYNVQNKLTLNTNNMHFLFFLLSLQ